MAQASGSRTSRTGSYLTEARLHAERLPELCGESGNGLLTHAVGSSNSSLSRKITLCYSAGHPKSPILVVKSM